MKNIFIYNSGYDPETGIGELIDSTTVNHARTMIHRGVADPVEFTLRGDTIVYTAVALTRYIYPAWTEGTGNYQIGFSFKAIHDRDKWRCGYCGNKVRKGTSDLSRLATVDHIIP